MNVNLKAAREKSGKTQAQVAKEANISTVQYQNIEYGHCDPKMQTGFRIADAVGSTVEVLFR